MLHLSQFVRENNKPLDKTLVYEYNNMGNIVSVKTYNYTTGSLGSVISRQSFGYDTTYPDRLTSCGGGRALAQRITRALGGDGGFALPSRSRSDAIAH